MNNEDPLTNSPVPEQPELTTEPAVQPLEPTPVVSEQPLQSPTPIEQPVVTATPQPVMPPQPPVEQQPQFIGSAPTPPTNTRSFKPFIFGGIGLLIVAIVGIAAFSFFVPNQADYNAAIDSYNKVADANNKLADDIEEFDKYLSDSTSTPITKNRIEDDYQSYKDAFKEMKDLKALRDGETSEAYANLSKKNDEYTKYFDGVMGSYDDIISIDEDCSTDWNAVGEKVGDDITQLTSAYDEAVEPCKDVLENLQKSDEELIASLGKDALAYLEDVRSTVLDLVEAYQAGNQTAFLAAQGELAQLDEEYLTRAEKFEKDMKKESDDKSINDAAHKFKDVLEKKAKDSIF